MLRMVRKNRGGWSMLEMIIVIAIIGILTTAGFAYMIKARPHARLERAELELTGHLARAKSLAISEEIPVRMQFNMAAGQYYIEAFNRSTGTWDAEGSVQDLPEGISITDEGITFNDNMVRFTTRGTLMSGGTITLTNDAGESSVLTGNVATGRFPVSGGANR